MKMLSTILALSACIATGCAEAPSTHTVKLALTSRTQSGDGVKGVMFWVDGKPLGSTNAVGELVAHWSGAVGQTVLLTGICPQGYDVNSQQRKLVMRSLLDARHSPGTQQSLAMEIECRALLAQTALVVRTGTDAPVSLPVLVDGQLIGQTDESGVGHFLLAAQARGSVRVTIDTRAQPNVAPQNPSRVFELQNDDNLLFYEPELSKKPVRPHARVKTRTPVATLAPSLPYQIR